MKTSSTLLLPRVLLGTLYLACALGAGAFQGDDKSAAVRPPPVAARQPSADQLAVAGLAAKADVQVSWHARLGTPLSIRGSGLAQRRAWSGGRGLALQGGGNHGADALAVMDNLARFYGVQDAAQEFTVQKIEGDKLGHHHVRLAQQHQGRRVVGGDLVVHFDKTGQPYQVNGDYVPAIPGGLVPRLTADEAARAAHQHLAAAAKLEGKLEAAPVLVIFARGTAPQLAYELTLTTHDPKTGPGRWRCWIGAERGEVVARYNDIKKIAPPTANGTNAVITGNILAGEGGQSISVTGRYENTGFFYLYNTNRHWYVYNVATSGYADNNTYAHRATNDWGASDRSEMSLGRNFDIVQRYFTEVLGRASFDDAGIYAEVNAHEGVNYVNAYWDGSAFFFGDGNGTQANSLAVLDICGHEFTHAVTEYTAGLVYADESGALNESFSDIFGAAIEFYAQADGRASYPGKTPGLADWLCGEDSWLSSTALRDLRNPANPATVGAGNEQPSRYHGTHWYSGSGDNGGVHQNSGVQNFLFYLLCEGGSGNNDGILYNVAGLGLSNAQQVAYRALTVYCTANTDYEGAHVAWLSAAQDLNPAWVASVSAAWAAVGFGPFAITPETSVSFRGDPGGPFTPATQVFTLLNRSGDPLNWSVTHTQAWLNVSPVSGTIPAGASVAVALSVNAAANALPLGLFSDYLSFSNSLEATIQGRPVRLLVGQQDFFTELFEEDDNDLSFQSWTFTPNGSASSYAACREPASVFPTDPAGGSVVSLSDDSFVGVTLSGAETVAIYTRRSGTVYIGSNGYLTMDAGDTSYDTSFSEHFSLPRVAACFRDLNPGTGGTVSWKQTPDRLAVTFNNVRKYGSVAVVSFQFEMFFDGRIRVTCLELGVTDGLAGLSEGLGEPPDFEESDLTSYGACTPPDALRVTPVTALVAEGYEGGPFTPAGATYTLTNLGSNALTWAVAATPPWLSLSPTTGALPPSATATVTASLNAQANLLVPGAYSGSIRFSNETSAYVESRGVALQVVPLPQPPVPPFGPRPTNMAAGVSVHTMLSWNSVGAVAAVPGSYGVIDTAGYDGLALDKINELPGLSATSVSWPVIAASSGAGLRAAYEVICFAVDPSGTDYANLRSAVAPGQPLEQFVSLGGTLVLNVAGNNGSQADLGPGGLDYDRSFTHEFATLLRPAHPYVTGAGYGGTALTAAMFNNWGLTDHGTLTGLPSGAVELLANGQGASMIEYAWGAGRVIASTLTFGWASGPENFGAPFENQLLYAAGGDESTGTKFHLYLGTGAGALSLIAANLDQPVHQPGLLAFNTAYYWRVVASNVVGSATGAVWSFTTALDEVHFAASAISRSETSGVATITVTRENPAVGVSIGYSASNGTATAGVDYLATAGALVFPPGLMSTNFQVPILDDAVAEGGETVLLQLHPGTPGVLLSAPSSAVLTILDNDGQLVTWPYIFFDGDSYQWDVYGNGTISDGTSDAYDGGLIWNAFPDVPNGILSGRELLLGPVTDGTVEVSRRIYVPATQGYARFLEVVRNVSASPVTTGVALYSNLGSDSGTVLVNTSSGDALFATNDHWIVTDDSDLGGDPTLLHVFGNTLGGLRPSSVLYTVGTLDYQWNFTLAPGETKSILHFASQNPSRAAALAKGPLLAGFGLDALTGLDATDLARIVNFGWPAAPVLLTPVVVAGNVQLRFLTQPGQSYTVQYKNSLNQPAWQTWQTVIGNGGVLTVPAPFSGGTNCFYRLQLP